MSESELGCDATRTRQNAGSDLYSASACAAHGVTLLARRNDSAATTSADVTLAFGSVSLANFSQPAASAPALSFFCASAACDSTNASTPNTKILTIDAPRAYQSQTRAHPSGITTQNKTAA